MVSLDSRVCSCYNHTTMAKAQVNLIQLKNKESGESYFTNKNKKLVTRKIELKKYSKKLRKHVMFKETKK
jgi:large subunit ribosomal protein L33